MVTKINTLKNTIPPSKKKNKNKEYNYLVKEYILSVDNHVIKS